MSAFDTSYAAAVPEHLAVFGRSVTYREPERADVVVTASVGAVRVEEVEDEAGLTITQAVDVTILRDTAAADGGVANPNERGDIEIAGVRWPVEAVVSQTDTMTVVRCRRDEYRERTRGGYRER